MNALGHLIGTLFFAEMHRQYRLAQQEPVYVEPQPVEPDVTPEMAAEALRRLDTGEHLSPADVAYMGRNLNHPVFDAITNRQILALQQRILANMNEAA